MVAINTFSTLFVAAVVAVSAAPTPSPSPLLGPLGGHGQAAEPSCTVPCFSPDTDSDQITKQTCKAQQTGLINVSLLDCTNLDLNILSIVQAPAVAGPGESCPSGTVKSCSTSQSGGLLNLGLLDCSNVTLNLLSAIL